MPQQEKLFKNFQPVSGKEWMEKIIVDLKGDDFNRKLVWKTNEGFDLMPFYTREDIKDLPYLGSLPGQVPFLRGSGFNGNNWLIRQNIEIKDYNDANSKALDILMKGVDSLGFIIKNPDTISLNNIEILLKGIHLESVEINFLSEGKAKEILEYFIKIINKSGSDPLKIRGAIEADPLMRLMLNGKLCISFGAGLDYLADLMDKSTGLPFFRTIQVNASTFSNAGADSVMELAFGLSMGNEYMIILTDRNVTPDIAASKIRFSFGTGSNYFFEIAKLRAARLLWSLISTRYKSVCEKNKRMEIHSVTGDWNKTVYDRYVNLLRSQTEAMSAALGGADSITVEPFDKFNGTSGDFSERLARNQQLLLKEEAYFDKVADPAGGSYYIEMLTSLIADNAWKLFLKVEEKGGFTTALKEGFIQEKLREVSSKRVKDISHRKEVLLGINLFPDYNEKRLVQSRKVFSEPSLEEKTEKIIEPVKLIRGAEEIENLRIAADMAGKRPVAFMLTIGNPMMRRIRSQFSCNFFGCGGYTVIDNPGFMTVEEGVKAALGYPADIIVICSSDEEYTEYAPSVIDLVKGEAIVVIASSPASMEELKSRGIKHFISVRSDLVASLKSFNELLGIR